MILEYLSDGMGAESQERNTLRDLACACEQRARPLMDAVENVASRPIPNMTRPNPPSLGAYAPMDNRTAFAPIIQAAPAPRQGCRTCSGGRGDVNVNVNVAAGTRSSVGSGIAAESGRRSREESAPTFEGGEKRPRVEEESSRTQRGHSPGVVGDIRRVISEELRRLPQSGAAPAPAPKVEYRPFAVPRDRVVIRREQRPFAVVWDRIKRMVQPRDVNHPIDRVRLVPRRTDKPAFEGSTRSAAQPAGAAV